MATIRSAAQGILADENTETREEIIALLKKAYWMEIETVMSYIANSINPDGVRAPEEAGQLVRPDVGCHPRCARRLQPRQPARHPDDLRHARVGDE